MSSLERCSDRSLHGTLPALLQGVFDRDSGSWDTVNEKHRYTPDQAVISDLDKKYPLDPFLLQDSGWVDPIPFFKSRLYQMKRWNLTELNYQTDYFLLRQCK